MSEAEPAVAEAPDLDVRRRRVTRRILAIGAALALAVTIATGVAGADGRTSFVVMLLLLTFTTGAAALWATVTLLVDELRRRRPSRRRAVVAGILFLVTALLMAMVAGTGG